MILDGKVVAQDIYDTLKQEISLLREKPKLVAVLVGENSPSLRYINQKRKWAEYVWMDFELIEQPSSTTTDSLLEIIYRLNQDSKVHGYIVQLPLPAHIDSTKIIQSIDPQKDVDGFHPENQGKIVIWDESGLWACTPTGMIELLNYYNKEVIWKNIVVIGRSNIVGKPITNMLINKWATVTSCNSKTKNIEFYTKNADIVILAVWQPRFFKASFVSPHCTILDVGFSVIDGKIYWDSDFDELVIQGNDITPVPGWVGVLTVASLLFNTLKAYKYQRK